MFDSSEIMYAGTQASEDDKRLFVVFSLVGRIDNAASTAEGRNIYRDVEFVTIRVPGDKTMSVHRPVRPSDKQRFPLQYAAFKNKQGEIVIGTPLTLWPGIRPAQIKELEYFNIRTVEQLAAMADGVGGAQMMGITALRHAARTFVSAAKEQAPLLAVQKELEARDNTITALQAQMQEQGAVLAKLLANLGSQKEGSESKKGK